MRYSFSWRLESLHLSSAGLVNARGEYDTHTVTCSIVQNVRNNKWQEQTKITYKSNQSAEQYTEDNEQIGAIMCIFVAYYYGLYDPICWIYSLTISYVFNRSSLVSMPENHIIFYCMRDVVIHAELMIGVDKFGESIVWFANVRNCVK